MEAIISYILKFLIGGKNAGGLSSLVGYTDDPRKFSDYHVVIIPSPFFRNDIYGTEQSIPQLPLEEVEGIPLLFGSSKTELIGDTLITHADILASAYFLLTRYEEIRRRNIRDIHGRFPGKESLPYKAGFIHRPIVDEYGKLLRQWLRQANVKVGAEPASKIQKIRLTHDVDSPFFCRTFRNLVRETINGVGFSRAWKMYNGPLHADPYYTFPYLLQQAYELKSVIGKERCESIAFIKTAGTSAHDKPRYFRQKKDLQELFHLCETKQTRIGLHSSYDAGKKPAHVHTEKEVLEKLTGKKITCNRHHYLSSREPEDMDWLEKAGITDDFTMGYADIAGFRLGTSRPVRWINPENRRISQLLLHPLTAMDCSLSEPQYMGLDYEEALAYIRQLIEQTKQANGELTLLWHNSSVTKDFQSDLTINWQRKLYATIIEELKKA